MNLSLDEQRRLAELVTGKPHGWKEAPLHGNVLVSSDDELWSASLTGSPGQKAQALDVIVAAFNLPGFIHVGRNRNGTFYFLGDWNAIETEIAQHSDLLEAAARALLSTERG